MNRTAFSSGGQYVHSPKTLEEVQEAKRIRRETATVILAGMADRDQAFTPIGVNMLVSAAIVLADRLLARLDE